MVRRRKVARRATMGARIAAFAIDAIVAADERLRPSAKRRPHAALTANALDTRFVSRPPLVGADELRKSRFELGLGHWLEKASPLFKQEPSVILEKASVA